MRKVVKAGSRALRRQQADAARWGLTSRMIRVALAIYCLSKYNKEYVLDFAKHARKRRRTTLVEVDGEECPISQWFLDADLEEMLSVFTPETKEEVAIRTEAVKFVAERRAVEWVAAQNFHFGRAPGALSLVSNFSAQLRAFGVESPFRLDPPRAGRGPKLGRTARKWCQKMRVRWGLHRRTLAEVDPMTQEEVVSKAWVAGSFEPKTVFSICEVATCLISK